MDYIDKFLDKISMYRVVIYSLLGILVYSFLLTMVGIISIKPIALLATLAVIVFTATITHYFFRLLYNAPANYESSLITALLLTTIIRPTTEISGLVAVACVTVFAICSKYLISYKNKHIFNPTAISLVVFGLFGFGGAVWWAGSKFVLPVAAVALFFIARKTCKTEMVIIYIMTSVIVGSLVGLTDGRSIVSTVVQHIISWPTILFGIMLTEPLATPPTETKKRIYAVLVGAISSISFSVGPLFSTPELALVIGNLFSYIVGAKERVTLVLSRKIEIAKDTFELVFTKQGGINHIAGQYMEWTLPHDHPDNRGVRRCFTISSAPHDSEVRLGIKVFEKGSSFKNTLINLPIGSMVYGVNPAGDFILPHSKSKRVVWIAGGIGVTPFASQMRDLINKNEKRDITLFYANKTEAEIGYVKLIDEARMRIGMKYVSVLADKTQLSVGWIGESGFIDKPMLDRHLKDIPNYVYYISGPQGMVESYKKILSDSGVPNKNIITDYFPGFV